MREIRFSIKHRGCWSSESYEKFPEVKARLLSVLSAAKSAEAVWPYLWKIEAKDSKQLDSFLKFFKNHKTIKKAKIVSKTDRFAIVYEHSKPSSAGINITIQKNNCYAVWEMSIDHGFERWQVLAENPKDLTNLIKDLNEVGELIIEKIGKYEPKKRLYGLTEKQKASLNVAFSNGYYSWPRKITLDELAAISGTTRRTFQDHLRKAESKVFRNVIESLS